MFFAGVVDTGDKLFTGDTILVINYHRCRCYWRSVIAGVVDTGKQSLSRIFIDSMTPAIINHRLQQFPAIIYETVATIWTFLHLKVNIKSKTITVYECKQLLRSFLNFSHLFLMPLIPVINLYFWISPRIFVRIRNDPNGTLRGPGEINSRKKTWSRKSRVRLLLTFGQEECLPSLTISLKKFRSKRLFLIISQE